MVDGGSRNIVAIALACNAGIAAAKFATAMATGSSALLAEAVHSLVDACNQALMLVGLGRAARPGGKAEGKVGELYFWSFVATILLFAMGAGVAIHEGAARLARPAPLADTDTGYFVLGIAGMVQIGLASFVAARFDRGSKPLVAALRQASDPSFFALLLQAVAGIIGVAVAGAGIAATQLGDTPQADGNAAIVVGLILALVAAFAAIEIKRVLTVRAASAATSPDVRPIVSTAASAPARASQPASPLAAPSSAAPVPVTSPKPHIAGKQPPSTTRRGKKRR